MNIETVENAKINQMQPAILATHSRMAKNLIQDADNFTRIKLKINNLLWEELPTLTTIGKADSIASDIMCLIIAEIEKQEQALKGKQ